MLKDKESIERAPSSGLDHGQGEGGGCAGCGCRIHDRFYLSVVDRQWHVGCLKCCECNIPLDAELKCFAREGNIFCKDDYYRMFAVTKCGRCQAGIAANELVMRARDSVYHLHCFSCTSCGIPLAKGDHFGMRDGLIYCRPHYELLDFCDGTDAMEMMFRGTDSPPYSGNNNNYGPHHHHKGRPRKRKLVEESRTPCSAGELPVNMRMAATTLEMLQQGDLSSSMESLSYDSSVTSPASSNGHQSQRTKRMRTSFKHHQLRTMKTYFAINQNPDAKDLKQLAQKTGLSKRVLQVWFQNARAKWRRNIMRQEGSSGNGNGGGLNQGSNGPPSVGLMGAGENLPAMEELHQHLHHSQNSQTLNFSDIY